jgi:AcrR family transcriptional regulator
MIKPMSTRRPGRPRGEEVGQGERRIAILTAAQDLFQQRGYAAVTISDVAAAVGVTKAAVHYHFDTKADLYAAVMRSVLKGIEHGIRAMSEAPGSVTAKLHRLASFAVVSVRSNADLDAMMRDADEHLSAARRLEIQQANAGVSAALADLMRDGIAAGDLADADPGFLAHAFWHTLAGFAGRAGVVQGYQGRPEIAAALVELFLNGAGRRPTPGGDHSHESANT